MAQHVSTRLDGATGIDEILDTIPAEARLLLRDHIKGLEAEAGTARSLATRSQRLRDEDVATLQMLVDNLRRERDELRLRVAYLDPHLTRRLSAAVISRAHRLAAR
jgi:hypothetical protein